MYHTVFAEQIGEVFNLQWFSGHHVAGYGVLLAPVAAVLGIGVTGIVSALVASWAFDQLLVGLPGRQLASWWFGVGTLVNLLIGRLPFALGLALGLCALLALRRGHYVLALGLAAATMLGSPVAGAFLALAVAAWTLNDMPDRLWRGVGLGVACFGPYLADAAAVPVGRMVPVPRPVVRHRRRHLAAADRVRAEAAPRDPHRGGAPHRRRRRDDGRCRPRWAGTSTG